MNCSSVERHYIKYTVHQKSWYTSIDRPTPDQYQSTPLYPSIKDTWSMLIDAHHQTTCTTRFSLLNFSLWFILFTNLGLYNAGDSVVKAFGTYYWYCVLFWVLFWVLFLCVFIEFYWVKKGIMNFFNFYLLSNHSLVPF